MEKFCPVCQTKFKGSLIFCPQDGGLLTEEPAASVKTKVLPKKQKSNSLLILGGIIGLIGLVLGVGLIGAGLTLYSYIKNIKITKPTPTPYTYKPRTKPPKPGFVKKEGKLKFDIGEKVKGSFGRTYLKVSVTNVGKYVIADPSVSLIVIKDGVKSGSLYGRTETGFLLRPKQTIPIWVDVTGKKYTSLKVKEENFFIRVARKEEKDLFPEVEVTETKMTSKRLTSLFNGRPYKENFYQVTGIIKNPLDKELSPRILVIYYDSNSKIVGIRTAYANKLSKGEKGSFKTSIGHTSLFGKPESFKVVVVDPS